MTDNRTTELREKLTERGVEWRDKSNGYVTITAFVVNGIEWNAIEKHYYIGSEHDWMKLRSDTNVTPEQAIAATLGNTRACVTNQAEMLHDTEHEVAQRIQTLEREIATLKEHRVANMERLRELTDTNAEMAWRIQQLEKEVSR